MRLITPNTAIWMGRGRKIYIPVRGTLEIAVKCLPVITVVPVRGGALHS